MSLFFLHWCRWVLFNPNTLNPNSQLFRKNHGACVPIVPVLNIRLSSLFPKSNNVYLVLFVRIRREAPVDVLSGQALSGWLKSRPLYQGQGRDTCTFWKCTLLSLHKDIFSGQHVFLCCNFQISPTQWQTYQRPTTHQPVFPQWVPLKILGNPWNEPKPWQLKQTTHDLDSGCSRG